MEKSRNKSNQQRTQGEKTMKKRLSNLKKMNDIILRMNNEEAYETWIMYVPDEATEDDLKNIAEDVDDYDEVVDIFIRIIYKYGSDSDEGDIR